MVTIAIIVHPKNEEEVFKFVSSNRPLFSGAKLIITRTEKNRLDSLFDKSIISSISSLELKGDFIVASKAKRGELTAVFYFSPQPEAASGLLEIISSCSKRRVYLGLNAETIDCIFSRLRTGTLNLNSIKETKKLEKLLDFKETNEFYRSPSKVGKYFFEVKFIK